MRSMKRLNHGLKRPIVNTNLARYVKLWIIVILAISSVSCGRLSKRGEIETTVPKIVVEGEIEYWCFEKTDATALLQEAVRNCE